MRKFLWLGGAGSMALLAGGLALWLVPSRSVATPRVEADPSKMYKIDPSVGPWVICAASFTGPDSHELARQTIFWLRQKDSYPAYLYDRGEAERQAQHAYLEQVRRERQLGPETQLHTVRIEDQCAVLIGGYRDMESAAAALRSIKKLPPPELDLGKNKQAYDTVLGQAPDPKNPGKMGYMVLKVNPFANSFVTRNPSIPEEQANEKKIDPLLKDLNADEEFSLLRVRAPWTLAVKIYPGVSCVQSHSASSSLLDKLPLGQNSGKVLNAGAMQAHETARVLRLLHYDAYVLHTRKASYVSVSGFNSPDDPALKQLADRLYAESQRGRLLEPLQLAAQPAPMHVPQP